MGDKKIFYNVRIILSNNFFYQFMKIHIKNTPGVHLKKQQITITHINDIKIKRWSIKIRHTTLL